MVVLYNNLRASQGNGQPKIDSVPDLTYDLMVVGMSEVVDFYQFMITCK